MGRDTFTRAAYTAAASHTARDRSRTERTEQQYQKTHEIPEMVDPKGGHLIRPSRLRFDELPDGRFELTVGPSMPVEVRFDTTSSMGRNIDIAVDALADLYELLQFHALSRYDTHVAFGNFNDIRDNFSGNTKGVVMCRSQFEMIAEKIVAQLTQLIPMRKGGDEPEDPHYGLFGATWLTDWWINKVGLKGYDFTISDATAHPKLIPGQVTRIYGDDVFDEIAKFNAEQSGEDNLLVGRSDVTRSSLPTLNEMVEELLTRTHAFFLQVGDKQSVTSFWTELMGADRVVVLPKTELLPQVMASIIGLTEGTLDLQSVPDFLEENGVDKDDAKLITRSVSGIPIGAQAALPNFDKLPEAGDIYASKTDLWPVERASERGVADSEESEMWLT